MRSTRTRRARRYSSTGCWRSASPPRQPSKAASVTAVVAAAGSGQRLGAGGPKSLVPVAGRPMVDWSIEALRAAGPVGPVVVACPPGHLDELSGRGVEVVAGGATRSASVSNALEAVDTELVAIHDAARPLVSAQLVEGVVARLIADSGADGAIAAAPVTDTIKRAAGPGRPPAEETQDASTRPDREDAALVVESTVDRDRLWAAQTPQVFRVAALREALDRADPRLAEAATDEAMVVEAAGGRVLIYPAPPENLKVTTPLDLRLAELLLARRSVAQ